LYVGIKGRLSFIVQGGIGVNIEVVDVEVRDLLKIHGCCNLQLEDGGGLQLVGLNNEN
jgi:hypothetical protein